MSDDSPLETVGKVTLDSTGSGVIKLGPQVGNMWLPSEVRMDSTSVNNIPFCQISIGNATYPLRKIDQTFQAYNDASTLISGQQIYPGQFIWAQISNGDVGADTTMTVHGIERRNYRR